MFRTPLASATVPDGPAVRMMTVLLASTDPLGWMAAGSGPAAYTSAAVEVVASLREGGEISDVLRVLSSADDIENAASFARAAVTWWSVDADARGLTRAA